MKKRIRIIGAVVFAFLTIIVSASAAEATIEPRWTYVSTVTGYLDISSGGMATLYGGGTAVSSSVNKVKVVLDLQQFKNGKWESLNNWDATSYSQSVRTSTHTWPVYHGYSYRLYVTLKAYNNNTLLETGTHIQNFGYFS